MRRAAPAWAALALAALVLAACSAIAPAPPPVRTFRLAYEPPPPPGAPPTTATLRVVPFGIAALYDRQGFVYRDGPYDIAVDNYNRWLGNPAAMITDLLAHDLAASGKYRAVLQAPSALPADYELNGQIEVLEERADGGCTAALRLRVTLVRVPPRGARSAVFEQVFSADEPCGTSDPAAFAAAMSRALQRVSQEMQAALLAATEREAEGRAGDAPR